MRTLFGGHVADPALPGRRNCPKRSNRPADRRHVAGADAGQSCRRGRRPGAVPGTGARGRAATRPRHSLLEAAREETDHLAWCAQRIEELGGRTSLLNPLWYAGSFAIGALAGLAGDRTSLGFVAETERQVVEHLEGHLQRLPADDARTRAIIQQMSADEARHGHNAMQAGGADAAADCRALMKLTARIMTRTAYWI